MERAVGHFMGGRDQGESGMEAEALGEGGRRAQRKRGGRAEASNWGGKQEGRDGVKARQTARKVHHGEYGTCGQTWEPCHPSPLKLMRQLTLCRINVTNPVR